MDTPDLHLPLVAHPDAARYEQCGLTDFQEEPLYQRLCRLAARSPCLLALHDAAPPTQRRATLWLAALHDQVLALGRPEGLGAWFASVGGTRDADDAALPAALMDFTRQHDATLRAAIASRHTQTNEIGRCSVLWPALAQVAALGGGAPLALFDFGASAGLNLGVDRYALRYQPASGGVAVDMGPAADARVPQLACRVHGAWPPLTPAWSLAARLGTDLRPVDVTDEAAVRWLRACLWPGDAVRATRLQQALALARRDPLPVQAADDGLALLQAWLDTLPAGVTPVLWHSWVLAYFEAAALQDFRARAEALVAGRGLVWLSAEDGPRTQALTGLALPTEPLPAEARADPASQTFWALTWRGAAGLQRRLLARAHPHGAWLAWLAGAVSRATPPSCP